MLTFHGLADYKKYIFHLADATEEILNIPREKTFSTTEDTQKVD